ncbi:MAG: glycine cleavage system protein GcvH [Gammaproteobacteria bacterium]
MNNVPADLKYTRTHEWVRDLKDGTVEIGITDHAQHALGDLVFVEVPETGRLLGAGEPCAVVESVKAASDVYSPLAGEVTAGNPELAATPELINQDAFGAGWLMRVKPANAAVIGELMSPSEYEALLKAEGA